MLKDNTHVIRTILGASVDLRDKVRLAVGDSHPEAITCCGVVIPVRDRQRIARLGEGDPMLLCDNCLSRLMLIE